MRRSAVWAVAMAFALGAFFCYSIGWAVVTGMVLGEQAILIVAALLALPACLAIAAAVVWRGRPAVAPGLALGVALFWLVAGVHMLLVSYALSRIALAGLQR